MINRGIFIVFIVLLCTESLHAQFRPERILVSYNGLTQYGRNNRDSAFQALRNLGIPFDSLDRNAHGSDTIDYTPYNILVWASGDPNVFVTDTDHTGQAGLSAKEISEVEKFLNDGNTSCKKGLVIAGQNIAYEHGALVPNRVLKDTTFLQSYLRVHFVANSPVSRAYNGRLVGAQPLYWKFSDSLASSSPDVVSPAVTTPNVGPIVNGTAYWYSQHPQTPSDSGAGVSFYNPSVNIIFYAFDWADPIVTVPGGAADTTSGVTRIMAGAFAFFRSHALMGCANAVNSKTSVPDLELEPIVPNPTEDFATITVVIPTNSFLSIRILDKLGRTVRTICNNVFTPEGAIQYSLDLRNVSSGSYTCEVRTQSETVGITVASENFIVP